MAKILKICGDNRISASLTAEEKQSLGAAFSRAKKPVEHIVQLLEMEVVKVDNALADTKTLYDKPRANEYIASQLGRKAAFMELHKLLTILDDDQSEK